jgi:hypothetical protein
MGPIESVSVRVVAFWVMRQGLTDGVRGSTHIVTATPTDEGTTLATRPLPAYRRLRDRFLERG